MPGDRIEPTPSEFGPGVPADAVDRILEAVARALLLLPAEAAARLKELLDPAVLTAMALIFLTWAGLQFTAIGWVADLALLALGAYTALRDAGTLIMGVRDAYAARTMLDLDASAQVIAEGITRIGVDVIAAFVGGKVVKAVKARVRPRPRPKILDGLYERLFGKDAVVGPAVGGVALAPGATPPVPPGIPDAVKTVLWGLGIATGLGLAATVGYELSKDGR